MPKQLLTIDQIRNTPAGRLSSNAQLFEKKKATKCDKFQTGQIITKVYVQKSVEKMAIETSLLEFANERGLVLFGEYYFHPVRKWRFDWCIKELRLAVEYNGIMSKKSRHTTIGGYSGDMKKINEAMKLGYRVLQYTPLNYGDLKNDLITI